MTDEPQTQTQRLAAALLADRDKPTTDRTDIIKCFMCGCLMVYRGSRFCSDRCRDCYDSGEPAYEQDWRRSANLEHALMADLKIVAGPPGIEVGSGYYIAPFGQVPIAPTRLI